MAGWIVIVRQGDVTVLHETTYDWSYDRQIREAADQAIHPFEDFPGGAGCGYPNRYLVRNAALPTKIAGIPAEELLTVELWDVT